MRIFVYEFVTAGGWSGTFASPPLSGLATEGRAMLDALVADLAATGWVEVLTLRDQPTEHSRECEAFEQLARRADATVIIAPEFDEILATRHRWAAAADARVIGSSLKIIELAADKQRTTEHLARHGLKVPLGRLLASGQPLPRDFPYPAVLKPVDGAGSLDVRSIDSPDDLAVLPSIHRRWRLERFCPGMTASVSLLCGPHHVEALPACRQLLAGGAESPTSRFAYRGGRLPLAPSLDQRARYLGRRVAATLVGEALGGDKLGSLLGWLGVDLILGDDPSGEEDVVIEINPRLTTSYLGLRRLARENLAAALVAVAQGEPSGLSFRAEQLQFAPDGCVTK